MATLIDNYQSIKVEIDGKWWIARPISGKTLAQRIRDAWLVLRGKAEAVTFYKQ